MNCTFLACNELYYSGHILSFFLVLKPNRCSNFHNFILELNSTCFGQFLCPSSGVSHCIHRKVYVIQVCRHISSRIRMELTGCLLLLILILLKTCIQNGMTYTIAVCTVKNSWWRTEELSEICRLSIQSQIVKFSAPSLFYYNALSLCMVTWTYKTLIHVTVYVVWNHCFQILAYVNESEEMHRSLK